MPKLNLACESPAILLLKTPYVKCEVIVPVMARPDQAADSSAELPEVYPGQQVRIISGPLTGVSGAVVRNGEVGTILVELGDGLFAEVKRNRVLASVE